MTRRRFAALAFLALSSSACFHQVVNTGRPPGTTVVEKQWAQGWLWGLVGPAPIETRPQCPSGVATVVTEMSFQNGVASVITFGIYTPMHVTITCASGGRAALPRGASELSIPSNATDEQRAEVWSRAAELSAEQHAAVVVRF